MASRYMEAEFASRRDRVSVQFSESGHEFYRIRRLLAYLSKFAENEIRLWLLSLMSAPLEAHRVNFAGNNLKISPTIYGRRARVGDTA
jgi:hypothetical protein